VVNSPSGLNPQLPPGTILTPGFGTNGFGLTGFNNTSLSPTVQFMLLQQAALNASISPEVTLPFLGIPTGVSPFGLSPLLPQGLTSLLPPGINVALPTPVINPFVPVINPFFGVNPFIAGVANPLVLSAQLNPLVALNLAPRRPIVIVSPRTSFAGFAQHVGVGSIGHQFFTSGRVGLFGRERNYHAGHLAVCRRSQQRD
jgi:hypothetical protein